MPAEVRRVREIPGALVPSWVHPGWLASFPWLVQGTTTRRDREKPLDFRVPGGDGPGPEPINSWAHLLELSGMSRAAYARQVHAAEVLFHGPQAGGAEAIQPCDGHATDQVDVLLGVTVADCVPVFVVSPEPRAIAVLHAGWRGVARGVLERGIELIGSRVGALPHQLHVHLGPAICGDCYEVGSEVFTALGLAAPPDRGRLDLRAILAARATSLGVDAANVTVSAHCTRCTGSDLFSHRGGDDGRAVGYLGIRRSS